MNHGRLRFDAARARALDRRMRRRLGDSLRYVKTRTDGVLTVPVRRWQVFLRRLAQGPISPLTFGAYCDLVLALDADDLAVARRCFAEITAAANHPGGPRLVAFKDPRRDRASARYLRLVDTDPALHFTIIPPRPSIAAACRARIKRAMRLLDAGCPALARELRALIREVVIAAPPRTRGAARFDGASSFMLWGAIVLNAEGHRTDLDMVQALAHESGHNVLFGLCADGSLLEDDDERRFASPLRADARPMDGLVHATYVIARMHLALSTLIRSKVLDAAARREAEAALDGHRQRFHDGLAVVDRHARLTSLGRSVIESARAYMARDRAG